MQPSVHCGTVYSNRDTEASWVSISGGMDTEDTVPRDDGILLSHEKGWNDAICSNMMDLEIIILIEVRQTVKNIIWYHLHVQSKKKSDRNELTKRKETHRFREQTYDCWREGTVRESGMDVDTLLDLINMENQQGPAGQYREVCSMSRGSQDGRGVWGRRDTRTCVADCLRCAREIVTSLLMSYSPIENEKFKILFKFLK